MRRIDHGLALAASLSLTVPALAQQDADIAREAVGDRAAELVKMELEAFDGAAWSSLTDWTNGKPLDASATGGKVVLIATWASWNPAASRILPMLQSLHKAHAEDGLLVVGVHHPTGWDKAGPLLEQRGVDFLVAHDQSGKFRETIRADQDPDFYVIDRAGQLRYADIRTEAVQPALKKLLAEDVTAASTLRDRLAAEAREREEAFRRPQTIQSGVRLDTLPEVPFVAPPEITYQSAPWPKPREDDDNRSRGRNQDAGPSPRPLPQSGWIGDTPPNTAGRVVVYYGWMLDDPRSAEISHDMDRLQRQYGRDVVVVGVCMGVRSEDRSRRGDQIDGATLLNRVENFRRSHGTAHPMLIDPGGGLFSDNGRSRSSDNAYPAAVVSSDNMTRWSGSAADPAFRAALDRVVDVDPGVRARRAAEQAYLRATGG